MFFKVGSEAREMRDIAEEWRAAHIEALSQPNIRKRLGEDVASTQLDYVHAAGVVALNGYSPSKRYSMQSERGLYLTPVPHHLPDSFRLWVTTKESKVAYHIGGTKTKNDRYGMLSKRHDLPGISILSLPTDTKLAPPIKASFLTTS